MVADKMIVCSCERQDDQIFLMEVLETMFSLREGGAAELAKGAGRVPLPKVII